jgi:SNF2 family DNA or RNA helicase
MEAQDLKPGVVIEGPFFPEPVKLIQVESLENGFVKVQGVGTVERKFYDPVLSPQDLAKLRLSTEGKLDFSADAEGFFLFLEAARIRNAFQFDPLFAVNVSQVDPLPHQIEAVYHYILQNPRPRFLLADDPGAGKTIMAGLTLKELKLRGLVERTLIVVPGHLKEQWLREMKERFNETFQIVDRGLIRSSFGRNVWEDFSQVITSMDFARQEDVLESLREVTWDLVIIDEAHKLSAYRYGDKTYKTKRYLLGEVLSETSRFLLFLTATPHRGDPENFRLFLDLLEPGLFANLDLLEESVRKKENPLFLRRLKEDLKDFSGRPLFPPRKVFTPRFLTER